MSYSPRFWDAYAKSFLSNSDFIAEYSNRSLFAVLNQAVGAKKLHRVLKTDCWNEGVCVSRAVLGKLVFAPEMYAVELSRVVCKQAHNKASGVFVSQGDIQNLPYQSGLFDLVIDDSTIDHVEDVTRVLGEYHRLLAKDGMLVLCYAENQPFITKYLNGVLDGVCLVDSKTVNAFLKENFVVVSDRSIGFLNQLFIVPPKRWVERFLWHSPQPVKKLVASALLALERSALSRLIRGYVGFRVVIAVKRNTK